MFYRYEFMNKNLRMFQFNMSGDDMDIDYSELYYPHYDPTYNFLEWMKQRIKPCTTNKNALLLLKYLGINSTSEYLRASRAVSCNDTFWVNDRLFPRTWEDINPYRFRYSASERLIDAVASKKDISTVKIGTKPIYTVYKPSSNDGFRDMTDLGHDKLKEKEIVWVTNDGEWHNSCKNYMDVDRCIDERVDALRGIASLYQLTGSTPKYVEYWSGTSLFKNYCPSDGTNPGVWERKLQADRISGIVGNALGISCVNYSIYDDPYDDDKKRSICKLFTNEDIGYIPYSQSRFRYMSLLDLDEYLRTKDDPSILYKNTIRNQIKDMIGFDILLDKNNRGESKFGFLFCTRTFRIIKLAPLFGNEDTIYDFFSPWNIDDHINSKPIAHRPSSYTCDTIFDARNYAKQYSSYGSTYHKYSLENYKSGYMNELMFALSSNESKLRNYKQLNLSRYVSSSDIHKYDRDNVYARCASHIDWLEEILEARLAKMRADV
jgi:hypothetical protein